MKMRSKLTRHVRTPLATILVAAFLVQCLETASAFAADRETVKSPESWRSELPEHDRLAMAVQKICPVMGKELGSMGEPVKVSIGGQHTFLCCKSCIGKQVRPEHWQEIQRNVAKAQATCPVMDKPIDAESKSTIVKGQRVFVCCPPCIEKIESETAKHVKKVDDNYAKHLANDEAARTDQLHAAAQKICPVSGQPLGSMGDPVKIKVGQEETAFLCCKACLSREIDAKHWKTIQGNLASAQGTCPVMAKPVDASMKSTVLAGRRVFVCCPPCIEKINSEPERYTAKVNSQVESNLAKSKESPADSR